MGDDGVGGLWVDGWIGWMNGWVDMWVMGG